MSAIPNEILAAAAHAIVDAGPTEKSSLRVGFKRAEAALTVAIPMLLSDLIDEIEQRSALAQPAVDVGVDFALDIIRSRRGSAAMSAGLLDVAVLAVLTRQLEPIAAATVEIPQPVEEQEQ